jgi:hypothetical protein
MPVINFTPGLGPADSVYYNVTYVVANQPPMMTTQTVWIIFALTGIILLLISVSTTSEMSNDLTGVLACPFLLISAIQSFAVDVITGSAFTTGTDNPYLGVMVQTHTIYHYDLIGVALGIIFVISLANLYRLWLDYHRVVDQPRPTLEQGDTSPGGRGGNSGRGQQNNRGRSDNDME